MDIYDAKGRIDEGKISKAIFKLIFIGVFAIFLIVAFFNSWYTVNAGEKALLITFGSPSDVTYGEGLHLKIPFIQKITKMSIQTQKFEADASAASKDLQIVTTHVATNYRIDTNSVTSIFRTIGINYGAVIIQPMEQEAVKATTAQFTAEELITKREEVRLKIRELLKERLGVRGIIVEEVSITNFDFSASFNAAIENKVTMAQNALAAQNKLEQIKFEAQQVEAAAIGQKNAKIATAQGDAEAIKIIQTQLSSSPQYINFLAMQKWDGKLSLVSGSTNSIVDLGAILQK